MVPIESPRRVAGYTLTKHLPELMMGGAAIAKRSWARLARKG
jgi:hypothetical protein